MNLEIYPYEVQQQFTRVTVARDLALAPHISEAWGNCTGFSTLEGAHAHMKMLVKRGIKVRLVYKTAVEMAVPLDCLLLEGE